MRNLQPKDKNVRVLACNVDAGGIIVIYAGYDRMVEMLHYAHQPGWFVSGCGPFKKAVAIEQCAALCREGAPK
jgi:hypothetical protein